MDASHRIARCSIDDGDSAHHRSGLGTRPQPARFAPSWRDWRDLLTLVLRARCRRALADLGLISPERQLAALRADLPAFERLRASVAPPRS